MVGYTVQGHTMRLARGYEDDDAFLVAFVGGTMHTERTPDTVHAVGFP